MSSIVDRELVTQKFREGKNGGAKWMLVLTDLLTYEEDYLFIMPEMDIVEEIRTIQREKFERQQTVTEVFNLEMPPSIQLAEGRSWNL